MIRINLQIPEMISPVFVLNRIGCINYCPLQFIDRTRPKIKCFLCTVINMNSVKKSTKVLFFSRERLHISILYVNNQILRTVSLDLMAPVAYSSIPTLQIQ